MANIESLEGESPFIEWVTEHGKKIVWGFVTALLILFLLFKLYSGSQAKAEKDFMEAAKLEPTLFQPAKAEETLEKLANLVSRHPSLQAEYDGLMAQSYLNLGQVEKAAPLVERTLGRIALDDVAAYEKSSEIALLISQGELETAYPLALTLKERLKGEASVLYFFNLLRLGMLEQALDKKAEEKQTWEEFLSYKQANVPAFQQLIEGTDTPGASLITFIEERQKKLKG